MAGDICWRIAYDWQPGDTCILSTSVGGFTASIPILWGYALLNIIHFWLASMGGYGLARSVLKVDYPAALLCALLVMLTPRLSSNIVGDVGYTYGLCWLPVCLLWTRLAFDRLSWRWAIAAGSALCCIYLTNIQFILYTGWLVGLYFAFCCVEQIIKRKSPSISLRYIGVMFVILATFAGLSAFNAFPFASYLLYQSRHAMSLADANYLALPVIGLMNAIFPIAQKFPEWEIYAGLLPLIFAPLALLYASRRELGWWLGLLIFAVLFSLGSATPLYSLMFYAVPGFSLLRVPARMWYVVPIALAMLTAIGVDGFLREKKLSARTWLWLVGSALLLSLFTIGGRFITRNGNEPDWLLGFVASLGIGLSLVGLWLWQRGRLKSSILVAIFVVTVMLDLFPLDVAFGTPRPISDFLQVSPIVQSMMRHAGENDDLYRVYTTRRAIGDAAAVANNLQTVEGLNSFQFAAYSQFVRAASGCDLKGLAAAVPPCISNEISETAWLDARPDPNLLGLLNTRYVITALLRHALLRSMHRRPHLCPRDTRSDRSGTRVLSANDSLPAGRGRCGPHDPCPRPHRGCRGADQACDLQGRVTSGTQQPVKVKLRCRRPVRGSPSFSAATARKRSG